MVEKTTFLNDNPFIPRVERASLLSNIADEIYQMQEAGEDVEALGLSRLLDHRTDFQAIKQELIRNSSVVLHDHRDDLPVQEVTITPPKGGNNGNPMISG